MEPFRCSSQNTFPCPIVRYYVIPCLVRKGTGGRVTRRCVGATLSALPSTGLRYPSSGTVHLFSAPGAPLTCHKGDLPAMTSRPIVLSDLDYTVIFDSVLADRSRELIEEIRRQAYFIVVTARSYEEYQPLSSIPNDGLVTENGAVVYLRSDGRDVVDAEWDAVMARRYDALVGFRDHLESQGWKIHYKQRAFSSSVTQSGKTQEDVDRVEAEVPEGLRLEFSRNTAGTYLEVFPAEAGKDQAVHRVCHDLGTPVSETFGLGDNPNDMGMLTAVNFPLAPGNCDPQVRELVQQRGGYVSPQSGHPGAQDILQQVLARL